MRILLLNPLHSDELFKDIKDLNLSVLRWNSETEFPLELAYIAAILRKQEHQVNIIDAHSNKLPNPVLKENINKFDPHIIGITSSLGWKCPIPSTKHIDNAIKIIKEVNKSIKTIITGPLNTLYTKNLFDIGADVLIHGEPEIRFSQVVEHINDLSSIKGISFCTNGHITTTSTQNIPIDLDMLARPAYDLLPMNIYKQSMSPISFPEIVGDRLSARVMTARGCPFPCSFCFKYMVGSKYRTRSIDKIIEELKVLTKSYNVEVITFIDDVFTLDQDRILKLCDMIIKEDLNIKWNATTRPELLNEKLLYKMKEAGCYGLGIGLESASQKVLDNISKGYTVEDVEESVRLCKKAGIKSFLYVIYFLPGETEETLNDLIKFIYKVKPDWTGHTVATPIPTTRLYNQALEGGMINENSKEILVDCLKVAGQIGTGLSNEQVRKISAKLNRKIFLYHIYRKLLSPHQLLKLFLFYVKNWKATRAFLATHFHKLFYKKTT